MINCSGFPPSVNQDSTILILGSMPGIRSLAIQQYYAHKQNRFWPLLSMILAEEPQAIYKDKLAMLLRHNIALWDSLCLCERDGSLDTAIKEERPNDFPTFFREYPQINKVCFNGIAASRLFQKHYNTLLADLQIEAITLPSTSPANARWHLEKLLPIWQQALLK